MPLIQVQAIKDVFSKEQKRQIISKLTDAMVSIEGENRRQVVEIGPIGDGDLLRQRAALGRTRRRETTLPEDARAAVDGSRALQHISRGLAKNNGCSLSVRGATRSNSARQRLRILPVAFRGYLYA